MRGQGVKRFRWRGTHGITPRECGEKHNHPQPSPLSYDDFLATLTLSLARCDAILKGGGRYVFECMEKLSEVEVRELRVCAKRLDLKYKPLIASSKDWYSPFYSETVLKLKKLSCSHKLSYTFRED